jgi:hypothetical protein
LNFQKLESDLKIAKVEVKRTMGVHARNKAALMAATEPGAPLEAYHQSEVSRKALTKAQKVYARIVKLVRIIFLQIVFIVAGLLDCLI